MKIKVRICAMWGEINTDTGEPIEKAYADLEFDHEDMAGDQIQIMEAFELTWAAIRSEYMTRKHGPKWYMKELKKKAEQLGQVWRA